MPLYTLMYMCSHFLLCLMYGDFYCPNSTLQMLTNIENRLEELFEQIEMMPQDKVELAEKVSILAIYHMQ